MWNINPKLGEGLLCPGVDLILNLLLYMARDCSTVTLTLNKVRGEGVRMTIGTVKHPHMARDLTASKIPFSSLPFSASKYK